MGGGGRVSITVTTDVFCDGTLADGTRCMEWVHGTTGPSPRAVYARSVAKRAGWKRTKGGNQPARDLCQDCARREEERNAASRLAEAKP